MSKGRGTRKAELKKNGVYVNPKDLWNLDITIAEFVLPRLKKFKELTLTYPEFDEASTFKGWVETLDKMILAFQYITEGDWWWEGNSEYDNTDILIETLQNNPNLSFEELHMSKEYEEIENNRQEEDKRRHEAIEEGLKLFAKFYLRLGW